MPVIDIQSLYAAAIAHREEHECSAYPYQHAEKLAQVIGQYQPRKVLEIGTGIGYTAAVMALTSSTLRIDTIEKDPLHAKLAREFLINNVKESKVWQRVSIINDFAETVLPLMQTQYDLIFFDGYQIHYEYMPHYERLLKPQGILFLANNHLESKTSAQFFAELSDKENWKILDQFDDTTIAQRV